VVEFFTSKLGPPIATPEWVMGPDGLVPARFRIFIWDCPVCEAGRNDPAGLYRPFSIDTDGNMHCSACFASERQIYEALIDP
jgi:hypothetical protein